MSHSETVAFARTLIERVSVTPDDAGCQELIAARLAALGFDIERMRFGNVDNLWARRGSAAPLLVFAGHTDVVPTGNVASWSSPPFEPTLRDGLLYGRGAADMKGSLAAMLTAVETLLADHEPAGSIGFLITSDEEGDAVDGTVRVMQTLAERGEHIDYCIVGEPSSTTRVGDVVRVGRRGSLNGTLVVDGIQGHVAYPDTVRNPIHALLAPLAELSARTWDNGDDPFPPTSFQISNLNAGTGASNVVPGQAVARFNFRFSTAQTETSLRAAVDAVLAEHLEPTGVTWHVDWALSGQPFVTRSGRLLEVSGEVLGAALGHEPEWSTSGGTSDGRFIAPTGTQLIELGPCNATIHQVDECVRPEDLDTLAGLYADIARGLL